MHGDAHNATENSNYQYASLKSVKKSALLMKFGGTLIDKIRFLFAHCSLFHQIINFCCCTVITHTHKKKIKIHSHVMHRILFHYAKNNTQLFLFFLGEKSNYYCLLGLFLCPSSFLFALRQEARLKTQ